MTKQREARRVHYVSYFVGKEQEHLRQVIPSAFTKVDYVKKSLVEIGCRVELVSTAPAKPGVGYLRKTKQRIGDQEEHTYLPSIWLPTRAGTALAVVIMWIQLTSYLLREVKDGDSVLVYHSMYYLVPLRLARRLRRFRLILEVEELYYTTTKRFAAMATREERFVRSADAYLMINEAVAARYHDGKPYALVLGSYSVVPRPRFGRSHFDEDVNVVYAGSVDPERKSAELLVLATEHLEARYVVHILGIGSPTDLTHLKNVAANMNEALRRPAVKIHEPMRGNEFDDFLFGCQVGVSSYSSDESFPSKISVYMAHNLKVVSPDIPCVRRSPFEEYISFYSRPEPECVADAIRRCVHLPSEPSNADVLRQFDQAFREALPPVIESRS